MRRLPILVAIATLVAGCGSKPPATAPAPALSLEGLSAQKIAVLPAFTIIAGQDGWSAPARRSIATLRALDAQVDSALQERGVGRSWVFPAELQRSYQHNPTYATDPYQLGEEPLRSPTLEVGSRLPDPLASQLRTLTALTDTRFVLAPIELRVQQLATDSTRGDGALKLAVLDARLSEVVWVGQVRSDPVASPGASLVASLGRRVADLFAAP